MKKTFVNPEMNISLFELENVLTESNGTDATNALTNQKVKVGNITTIDLDTIKDAQWVL